MLELKQFLLKPDKHTKITLYGNKGCWKIDHLDKNTFFRGFYAQNHKSEDEEIYQSLKR